MIKEQEEKLVRPCTLTNYKRRYILDASKGIYGRGFAVILEGEIVMNWFIWNKGTQVSPQDKGRVAIEWLKDLIKVLKEEKDN